jgi:hypothetical protein
MQSAALLYTTIVWCLCSCGRVSFDPLFTGDGGGSNGDGGGNGDGSGSGDGGSGACVGAVPATTFPGGLPCANWGGNAAFSNAGLSESSGTLIISPNANTTNANGRCQRDGVTFGPAGAWTEVSQVLAGASSTTRLELVWGTQTYYIGAENGGMRAGTAGVTLSGGAIARWWKMWPVGNQIHYETSADGITWDNLGFMGANQTGTASLRVVASTPNPEAAPGTARFESVNVCP